MDRQCKKQENTEPADENAVQPTQTQALQRLSENSTSSTLYSRIPSNINIPPTYNAIRVVPQLPPAMIYTMPTVPTVPTINPFNLVPFRPCFSVVLAQPPSNLMQMASLYNVVRCMQCPPCYPMPNPLSDAIRLRTHQPQYSLVSNSQSQNVTREGYPTATATLTSTHVQQNKPEERRLSYRMTCEPCGVSFSSNRNLDIHNQICHKDSIVTTPVSLEINDHKPIACSTPLPFAVQSAIERINILKPIPQQQKQQQQKEQEQLEEQEEEEEQQQQQPPQRKDPEETKK